MRQVVNRFHDEFWMTLDNDSGKKTSIHDLDSTRELEKLRRGITVLFTDIKGSTAYFERFGDAAGLIMVNRCNGMIAKAVEHHGRACDHQDHRRLYYGSL